MTISEIPRTSARGVSVRRRAARSTWVAVCSLDRLTPDRGVAALIGSRAVAIFRLGDGSLYCIDNVDPVSGASILSRGLVGDADSTPTVASPMYKQRFDLRSGHCLDRDDVSVAVHEIRLAGGTVEVRLAR
jgi:nitrite reductase (NADH) small subunit